MIILQADSKQVVEANCHLGTCPIACLHISVSTRRHLELSKKATAMKTSAPNKAGATFCTLRATSSHVETTAKILTSLLY